MRNSLKFYYVMYFKLVKFFWYIFCWKLVGFFTSLFQSLFDLRELLKGFMHLCVNAYLYNCGRRSH
jgi:hypothetical protein